jgi:hypothetical protein
MQECEGPLCSELGKAFFPLAIVQPSSPCVNRAVHSIRKIMGSYPKGETGMATVAEQTMAIKRRKSPNAHRSTLR